MFRRPLRATQPEREILISRRKRQQGDVPRLLDGARQSALVRGAHTGQTAGDDLAPLGDKLLQQPHIAVVDGVDLLHAELADLLAPEEFASSGTSARAARTSGPAPAGAASAGAPAGRSPAGRSGRSPAGRSVVVLSGPRGGCWCAGFVSHGFPSFFSRPWRDRPCAKQDRLYRSAGAWPASTLSDAIRRSPRSPPQQAQLRLPGPAR